MLQTVKIPLKLHPIKIVGWDEFICRSKNQTFQNLFCWKLCKNQVVFKSNISFDEVGHSYVGAKSKSKYEEHIF